jgi:transposase
MKQKTSLTLSEDVIVGLKKASRRGESRSQTVDRLLRERLADQATHLAHAREVEQINRHAEALNAEALEVLIYQGDV